MNDAKSHAGVFPLCCWMMRYAWHRWLPLAAVVGTMVLKIGLDVLKPWPMVFLIDYALKGEMMSARLRQLVAALPGSSTPLNLVGWCIAATVITFLLSWVVGLANSYANISLGQRMVYDLAAELFAKLQQLSLHFHLRRSVGDIVRRVSADCTCVSVIVKDALVPVCSSLLSLAVMFTVMWRIDAALTVLALMVTPCMMLAFRFYAQPMLDRSYMQQEVEGNIYSVVEQTFSAIPVVQAFGREEFNDQRFQEATRATVAATLTLTSVQMQFKILIGLATALGTAGMLWLGSQHVLGGQTSIGEIILFLSYLGSLYAPLEAVMYSTSTIQGGAGSARRVWEVLHAERSVADVPGAIPLTSVRGQVRFEKVTFGYEPGRPVLHNLSLEVRPGETVALVGPTGAGKSTLVSLLPRFFDPWEGQVLIDDHDVRSVQLKTLRQQVALVLQEPFLFPRSVAENIAYGRPQASAPEIEAAARAANAHEFIVRLPEGYQTVIGERGATLSGGERQRLSIARALLKNAPILILDEPTSALDAETEHLLMEAVERLTRDRTTFIIAHRLSTVRRADRIVTLAAGHIAEIGTHDELIQRAGTYARFHKLQSGVGPDDG